jgi:hypothetical protein
MRPSLLQTPTDKKIGRPAGIISTSDHTVRPAYRSSPTRFDRRRPRVLSTNAEDDFTVLQRQPTYLDIDDAVAPDEYDPFTGPYGSQNFTNGNTLLPSPPSGYNTPMITKSRPSQALQRRGSSYFGNFSFDQHGCAIMDPNTEVAEAVAISSSERILTPYGTSNVLPDDHPQFTTGRRASSGPTALASADASGKGSVSTVSTTLSSDISSKETEYSRVSTFGRWFNKGSPDLRMVKFAKDRRISLRRRQEAEPPPPEPSPRITSFYHKHEYDRLQRERDRQIEEKLVTELEKSTDEPLRRPSMLKKAASSLSLATSHTVQPAIIRAVTTSSRDLALRRVSTPDMTDAPIPDGAATGDQRPATPGPDHHRSFWQPRRRLSAGFSHSVMEGAQLARSRRTFREPSSDNSDKSSLYPLSPRHLHPEVSPGSPWHSHWFKSCRPRTRRFHSSEYSPGDTSGEAMNRPRLQALQSFPAARNPMKPPTKNATFLPTEARRVNTPPLVTTSHEKGNKVTGYFWDFWYNDDDGKEGNRTGPSTDVMEYHQPFPQPKIDSIRDSTAHPGVDSEKYWYRVRLDRIMDEDEPRDLGELRMFDWDIPEHLPSSPLCPLHPKHQGRGRRVCVYHGRRDNPRAFADLGVEAWR